MGDRPPRVDTDSYDLLRVNLQHTTQRQEEHPRARENALSVEERMDNVVDRVDLLEQKSDEHGEIIDKLVQMHKRIFEVNQMVTKRDAAAHLYKKEADKHFWTSHGITFLVGVNVGVLLVSLLSSLRK